MTLLQTVAPVVEPLGLDEAFLDMSDVATDYKAATEHAIALKNRVREQLGLTVSIGVADLGEHYVISFMEAPMPPANLAMESWVKGLRRS